MNTQNKTYFLAQDHNCHWYIVPTELKEVWLDWLELDNDDENAWEEPEGVIRVNGDPSRVKFEKFIIE